MINFNRLFGIGLNKTGTTARQRRDWSIVLIGPVRQDHIEIVNDIAQLEANRSSPAADLLNYIFSWVVAEFARSLPLGARTCHFMIP